MLDRWRRTVGVIPTRHPGTGLAGALNIRSGESESINWLDGSWSSIGSVCLGDSVLS